MKLPRIDEKFIVTDASSKFYGNIVSGVHVEIRADEDNPDRLWYYVRVDKAYEGDIVLLYGGYARASLTLEGALDYVAQHFVPYQEQEEESDEKAASDKAAECEDMGMVQEGVPELQGGVALPGDTADHDAAGDHGPLGSGDPGIAVNGQPLDRMDKAFPVDSLAIDLCPRQRFSPALSSKGGVVCA